MVRLTTGGVNQGEAMIDGAQAIILDFLARHPDHGFFLGELYQGIRDDPVCPDLTADDVMDGVVELLRAGRVLQGAVGTIMHREP